MGNYIIHYDIAALFVYGIVFYFLFKRKGMPVMKNRLFFLLVADCLLMVVLELLSTLFIYYPHVVPRFIIWAVNCLYYSTTTFLPFWYCLYSFQLIDFFDTLHRRKNKLEWFLFFGPISLILISIWSSPVLYRFTDAVPFYLDTDNVYVRGGAGFYGCYIISVYYVLFALLFINKYKKRLNPKKERLIFVYIILCLCAVGVQLLLPNVMVQCFIMALATLLFEVNIQHPEEVIDVVTGLSNQTAFVRTTAKYKRNQTSYVCIGIILDDTVFLSNTFGLDQFNMFYSTIAETLAKEFPKLMLFYLGGGRFSIILKNSSKWDVQKMVGRIQTLFRGTWKHGTIELKLYARICIINVPEDASKPEDIIDIINLVAEDERYKQSVVYSNEIDIEYKHRAVFIEHALRNGLFENRFEVYFQPIYSTHKKTLIGAEALIRLKDDDGNFISPEIFIPIAEKTGTILRIGEFVFESVCKTLSEINIEEYGIEKIDINLSVAQCMQEILAEQILTIRSMYMIPTSVINLEITETAMAHTPDILLSNMKKLADAGIELSLDDYGSGYSNMNYMLSLPFKMIKIDKGIVWSAAVEERSSLALKATVAMISQLDMTVLAEGVETKEQAEWLSDMGCDYLQGYYYSRPIPKQEFLDLMKKNHQKQAE